MKSFLKTTMYTLLGGILVSVGALSAPQDALAWKPTKPVEFVIQTSPGGGSDIYTRLWTGVIEKHNLSPVPFTPINMPGGSGAVALTYLHSQKGGSYAITPTLNSIVTTPLQVRIPVMYTSRDLTPIALMTIDPFLLWVNPSKYKNWEEFHAACKKSRLTSAGTGARQEDEIQIGLFQKATDCKTFRYIPESGGGKVAANVAGGHVDFSVNQPAEGLPHYPGKMIPIISFSDERLDAWPKVPTHRELKIGTSGGGKYAKLLSLGSGLHQHRGIIGNADMPKEAVAWYGELFHKVFESKEWQDFMKKRGMVPTFKGPKEYKKWLVTFEQDHIDAIKAAGWPLRSDLEKR